MKSLYPRVVRVCTVALFRGCERRDLRVAVMAGFRQCSRNDVEASQLQYSIIPATQLPLPSPLNRTGEENRCSTNEMHFNRGLIASNVPKDTLQMTNVRTTAFTSQICQAGGSKLVEEYQYH